MWAKAINLRTKGSTKNTGQSGKKQKASNFSFLSNKSNKSADKNAI